jgi:hypothetical protein
MLAVGFARRLTVLVGALAAASCLAAAIPALVERAAARIATDRFAERLLRLDPGARVGGNTQVATAAEAVLVGVSGRMNFMMGLGPRQRIVGGPGHDQLGGHGTGAHVQGGRGHDLIHGRRGGQVLAGGAGHDHIFGGPGDDRLRGGPGQDRLVDKQGATVVMTGPGANRVDVADGKGDERVLCAPGSINRIRADRGDRLHPRCRGRASSVSHPRRRSRASAAYVAQQKPVSGDGSNGNPYIAACDDETRVDCVVSSFPARSLSGWWANEYVPAYKCPASHPYLYARAYFPYGTTVPWGVEVLGLGPIGVSISGYSIIESSWLVTGTTTGGFASSATNWTTGTNSYKVKLHCTSDEEHGFGPT